MSEPTASPDVTGERKVSNAELQIIAVNRMAHDTIRTIASELLALRQEVERLTREGETLEGEASIGRLFRTKNDLLRASLETAEASLRLATQRREDVVKALRGLDITDAELLRIRNNCELVDQNGMIEIWAMMLQKLVDHVRDLRALALQPKEN